MDVDTIASSDFGLLVRTLLPMVVGPLATWALKKVKDNIHPSLQPLISAIVGAITSVFAAGVTGPESVAVGFGLGMAGAKARDLAVGKPNAVSTNGKQLLDQMFEPKGGPLV